MSISHLTYFFASRAALIAAFSSSVLSWSILVVVLSTDIHRRDVSRKFGNVLLMDILCENAAAQRGLELVENNRSMAITSVVMIVEGRALYIFINSMIIVLIANCK